MNPQFDHKFLEQYLANKMSPVEKMAFEARLNSDKVLKAELEAMKRMKSRPIKTSANAPVNQANNTNESEEKSSNKLYHWMYIEFAIFALIVAAWLIYRYLK